MPFNCHMPQSKTIHVCNNSAQHIPGPRVNGENPRNRPYNYSYAATKKKKEKQSNRKLSYCCSVVLSHSGAPSFHLFRACLCKTKLKEYSERHNAALPSPVKTLRFTGRTEAASEAHLLENSTGPPTRPRRKRLTGRRSKTHEKDMRTLFR